MQIRQLQLLYRPDEDRLLLRINTDDGAEVRLWLTRRLVTRLVPVLGQAAQTAAIASRPTAAVPVEARAMMTDFARDAALSQADFSTPFSDEAASLPLGETPLLVTRIDLTPLPGGETRLGFAQELAQENTPNAAARSMEMVVGEAMLHAFLALLHKESVKAEWLAEVAEVPAAPGTRSLN